MDFANTVGFYGLLSVVPLIILYLIKPKPKLLSVPSLMFLMKVSGYNKITSFLRQVTNDWLFLIQLLALVLLSLVLTEPFSLYEQDITAKNQVIVIDASASMQVKEGSYTRLDRAISKALDNLAQRNSVVLAKQIPSIGIKDVGSLEAREYIRNIKATETGTRLGDAIILAGETLGGEGRVLVLSDFINTDGQDADTAKLVLQSKGIVVDFINVAGINKKNTGIISADLAEDQSTLYIKNFDPVDKTVTVTAGSTKHEIALPPSGIEPFSFQTPAGTTKITLFPSDDFPVDNEFYVVAPDKTSLSVLLVTSNSSVFMKNALTTQDTVKLDIAVLPIVPKDSYDLYVIDNIRPGDVLPGTFEDIMTKVEAGASVIVTGQDNMNLIDYKGLLPLKVEGVGDAAVLSVDQVNRFTKNAEFGTVSHYPIIKKDGQNTVVSAGQDSIIATYSIGKGKGLYFGILESASDFKFSAGYPIFWSEVMKYLTDIRDVKTTNLKTGIPLVLDKVRLVSPPNGGKVQKTSTPVLETQGVYEIDSLPFSANLLNERESSINANVSFGQQSINYKLQAVKEKKKQNYENTFIVIGMCVLLAELLYIKLRGDL